MTGKRLLEKVALITGGASGQGAAHARRLASEGATVYLADINIAGGAEQESALRADGYNATFLHLDVSNAEQWKSVADVIDEQHGHLDVLVNNAGMLDMRSFEDSDEQTWQRTVDVNQKSVFLGLKLMLPLLRKGTNASIINTSSIFGIVGAPDYVAYHATKAAIIGLTKSAAASLGAEGIRVNSIHPGYIDTPMWQEELRHLPEGSEAEALAQIPLGRFAQPEEISSVVAFLTSNDASYITGAQIIIDGGVISV